MPPQRVVLHLDMDAFYAAVEVARTRSFAGKPLIIGHPGSGAWSRRARTRRVRSGCAPQCPRSSPRASAPTPFGCTDAWTSTSPCPAVSAGSWIEEAPVVEPLSIDEAFLDMSGLSRDLDQGAAKARVLKDRIRSEERAHGVGRRGAEQVPREAGVRPREAGRPVRLPKEDVPRRLWPLPVERLWGVGPKAASACARAGSGRSRTSRGHPKRR